MGFLVNSPMFINNPVAPTQPTSDDSTNIATTQFVHAVVSASAGVSSVGGTTGRITSSGGSTPDINIDAGYVGQASITTLGTIATGVWGGTLIGSAFGGTGINNGTSTITIGGNFSIAGAFALGLTISNNTTLTLPISGTLLTTTGSAAGLTSFPTLNQNTTGSAATLTTPRNINGVAFDGSAPITVTAAAGTLSGATLASGVTGSSLTTFGVSPTFVTPALGTPASGNLANCTFPTLNQNTTGSAATLTTPRAINSVAFDGSSPITVTAAAGTLSGTTLASGVTGSSLTSFGVSPVFVTPALGTPASGNLTNCTFPTLNQNTTGSAATLTTPRAINSVAFDGSAPITVTAAAGTLSGATLASGVTASSLTSFGASPTFVTPALGTPASGNLANCTFPTLNQNTSGTAANITASSNTTLSSLANLVTHGTITTGGLGTGAVLGGVTITLGSDGTGDLHYRASTGVWTRLGIGATNQILAVSAGGLPNWVTSSGGTLYTADGTTLNLNGSNVFSLNLAHANIWAGVQTFNAGSLVSGAGTALLPSQQWTPTGAVLLTTPVAGAEEVDSSGIKYYSVEATAGRGFVPSDQFFRLTANGGTIGTIANFFGTTSNITLVSGAEYLIEIECYFTNTTAGTVTWTFTNGAAPTLQNIYYKASPAAGIVAPAGSAAATYLEGNIQGNTTAAEALTTTATLTTATTQYAYFKIYLKNSTGTSLKIQATKLVGGTITPLAGSYWKCTRLPGTNVGIFAT